MNESYYHYSLSIFCRFSLHRYCATFEITYRRPHCRIAADWAKQLTVGSRMCVECQSAAMHPKWVPPSPSSPSLYALHANATTFLFSASSFHHRTQYSSMFRQLYSQFSIIRHYDYLPLLLSDILTIGTCQNQVWVYTSEQRVAASTLRYSGLRLAIAQADANRICGYRNGYAYFK